ncbi:MAG: hypothetical protein HPY50_15775 [Firmicutes bacterium]|nr:hypothetical protein [Bacillota bacterium]
MNFGVWGSLREVIDRIRLESERLLVIRGNPLSDFMSIDLNQPKYEAITAVFLGGAHRSRLESDEGYRVRVFGMASLFNLILLAADVHGRIRDNDCGYNAAGHNNLDYPVLLGDFIYGTLLRRLCDLDCIEILPDLAGVICDINEGAMRRDELSAAGGGLLDYMPVIRQEYGSAFRQAARTGMWMAGESDLEDTYSEMACYIGMAIGIEQVGMDPAMAKACRRDSLYLYSKLEYGSVRRYAHHLLRYAGIERKTLRAASGQ